MKVTLVEEEMINRLVNKIDQLELKFEGIVKKANYPLNERWLNVEEATQILNCSKKVLFQYRDNFLIPYTQINHKYFFKASDIEKFLNSNYKPIRGF
ncbi:MAG: helix-turn-helix domain-containing protein [Bacteroidia bacterium]|jgi:hypothetical protein|nr:helix-turn-helix domain-containing protein [Bacteroidia bacterium]